MVAQEEHKLEIAEEILEGLDNGSRADLIVFNDDVNTFEWVIQCFIGVCELSPEEAVEKTFYIHFNGQGVVRSGAYEQMAKMKGQLIECGLNAIVGRSREN